MELDMKLLIGLHRNVAAMDRATAKLAAEEGLTFGQFAVLEAIYSKGEQPIGVVRDRILSSVGTISVIVKNLEKRGFITRRADPADKRVCRLALTPEGECVIGRVVPRNLQMIQQTFAVLSQTEKEALNQMMRKIGGRQDGTQN